MTCAELGRNCGRVSDGCSGQLECGSCQMGAFCAQDGVCTNTIECLAGDAATLRKDVAVWGVGDLLPLVGIRRIEGNVIVESVAQADLAQLACLEEVSGELQIGASPMLTNSLETVYRGAGVSSLRGLDALTKVGGDLEIFGGPLVDLHGLERLQSVGGTLLIAGLPQLASLTALAALRELPTLGLQDLPALTSLTGLEAMTSLAGVKTGMVAYTSEGLVIARCSALRDLTGLDGVQHLGGFVLADNPALTSLSGLEGVRTMGCASASAQCNPSDLPLEITGTPELANLSALSNATGTLGLLRINGNQRLTELTELHGLVFDDISLSRNTALVRISSQPFPATSIKTLYLNELSALETLEGLNNLTRTLLDGINIRDNPVLRSLDALSRVTTVTGSFIVRRSPQLTAIGFPMLQSISRTVYIEGLTMVPKCQVDALLARTGATCERCTGLNETATCP